MYPSGAKFDVDSTGYLFFGNFFSDLGATKTYSGRGNTGSHALFSVALATVGLALMVFSATWALGVLAPRARVPRGPRLSAAGDRERPRLHRHRGHSLGPRARRPQHDGLELQVAAQKIIVYTSIANLGLQALGVRREQSAREGALARGSLHAAGPLL